MPYFFCLDLKVDSWALDLETKQQILLGLTKYSFCEVTLTKSCRISMRYFSEIVSKSCWRRISFYFKHKSQYLVNVKFVNIWNFYFFRFFPCIFCSINCSNSFVCLQVIPVLLGWCFPRKYSHNLTNYVRQARCSDFKSWGKGGGGALIWYKKC